MMKKILSIALVFCVMLSCIFATGYTNVNTSAANVEKAETSASTGPQNQIQGAVILHCFNWSYNSIKNNLQAIKDAGYTAVQTSPVQSPKDYNGGWRDQGGQWWKLYQPLDFTISNNTWLGTKSDLKALCDAADKMGMKVVVDIVANHVANKSDGGGAWNVNDGVASHLKRDDYYHSNNDWANDGSRYSMTQGHIGMPDLNTAHPDVQNIVKGLLVDCINQGVDGFRFDAAKHIELPTDSGCGSQFWPTVINGSQATTSNQIFYYGEILNGCGTDIKNFTQYMSITDNYSGDSILVAANNSNAAGLANSSYSKGAAPDKNVLWVESHDTYMGESGSAGISKTSGVSDATVIKAWAMVGSRADSTSLFFARPAHNMGDASTNTTYKSKAVTEVNKFKNYFAGQTEHLSHEGSIAYNERGTAGVVLVNASGTNASVNVRANKMAAGTYKDAITGSTFTVSNGRITGNIGNTGVAVVYNPTNIPTPQPTQAPTQAPTVAPTQPAVKYLVGDIDVDGDITVMDATLVQSYLSKKVSLAGKALKAADVDISSDVNVIDTTMIQRYVANISSEGSQCGKYRVFDGPIDPTEAPTQQPLPEGNYVYFKNTDNWSQVSIYYWSDADSAMISWPGTAMESIGNNEYRAEVPENATKVIFNNTQGQQTGDLSLPGFNKIYENGSWRDYSASPTPNPTVNPNPDPTSEYIYFKNNDNWGEVKAYYWSDADTNMTSWPGDHMESIGNNVYKCKVPANATKIIFNNNQGAQTGDIDLQGLGKIYDNGNWSNYNG